jgi:hypothetical protein
LPSRDASAQYCIQIAEHYPQLSPLPDFSTAGSVRATGSAGASLRSPDATTVIGKLEEMLPAKATMPHMRHFSFERSSRELDA